MKVKEKRSLGHQNNYGLQTESLLYAYSDTWCMCRAVFNTCVYIYIYTRIMGNRLLPSLNEYIHIYMYMYVYAVCGCMLVWEQGVIAK